MRCLRDFATTITTFLWLTVAAAPGASSQPSLEFVAIEWGVNLVDNAPCGPNPVSLSIQVFAEEMSGGTVMIPNHGLEVLELLDEDEGEWGGVFSCQFPLALPPVGQYHFVLNGPGGPEHLTYTNSLPLPASGVPTVTAPAPGATGVSVDPTFQWAPFATTVCATGGSCGINVELSNDLIQQDVEDDFPAITATSWTPTKSLLPEAEHTLDIEVFDNDFSWEQTLSGAWVLVKEQTEYENCVSFTTGPSAEIWSWYPEEPEGFWTGSDADEFDSFGSDVAISGDLAVVGADDDNDDTGGYARVFRRTGYDWQTDAVLGHSVRQPGDIFGSAVAIDGDTLVVGAGRSDHDGAPGVQGTDDRGSAFVYVRTGGGWELQQELRASVPADSDEFGSSVALRGDTIVVGATETDYAGATSAGSVYLFRRSAGTWSEVLRLDSPNPATEGRFGESVATSGADSDPSTGKRTWVAVGAPGEGPSVEGRAYVRDFDGATLGTAGEDLLGASAGDEFGASVSLDGDRLAIGAPAHDGVGPDTGAVSVHSFAGPANWPLEQELEAADGVTGDLFGSDVALSGDTLVVGACEREDGGFPDAGAVYVFDRDPLVTPAGPWSQTAVLTGWEAQDADFGESVAISGHTLVGGAAEFEEDELLGVGTAWTFRLFEGTWIDHGCALAGGDEAPLLVGDGSLLAGSSNAADLSQAPELALSGLFISLSSLPTPFKGGVLKAVGATPVVVGQLWVTDAAGALPLPFTMPAGIPSGIDVWIQWAIQDPEAVKGVALSNAICGTTP
jgi:hypothetical protein